MLRIHFTSEDLARTRVAAGPDPMWETVLSLQMLQHREGAVVFDGWRRQARRRLGASARMLLTLAPHAMYFPDFLTPAEGSLSLDQGLDTMLSTGRTRLREELGLLAGQRKLPDWSRHLADGDLETVRRLEAAFGSYHRTVVQPTWASVQTHIEADRVRRSRAFLDGGCEGVLNSFRPFMRWSPPVLECDYPEERDLHLGGRGLLLVPAYFCWRAPVTLVDPELQPVLVYPVAHDLTAPPGGHHTSAPDHRPLGALLGNTRAAVLRAVDMGCTTTELSRRVGTSVASASQHAAVLREAGLIATQRHGGSVLHTLTPLGSALLTGDLQPAVS